MPMPRTRSGISSRTEAYLRFGRSGSPSPAQVYRASVKQGKYGTFSDLARDQIGECPLFSGFTGVPLHERDRGAICAGESERSVSPRSNARAAASDMGGKEGPNGPNRSGGDLTGRCSPCRGRCASSRRRARRWRSRFAGGARRAWAGSAGSLSAGPCRTPQRERRSEALPSPCKPPIPFRLAPARARQRRKAVEEKGTFLFSMRCLENKNVPFSSAVFRSAVDLDRRKGTRPNPTRLNPTKPN